MPRGDKSGYTDAQKRQAEHIEESEKEQGRGEDAAARIAWATVNKQDGGGKKHAPASKATVKKTATKKTAASKTATKKKTAR